MKDSKEQFVMYRSKGNTKTIMALIDVEYKVKGNNLHIIHRTTSLIQQMNGMDSSVVDIKTFAPVFFYYKRDKQEEKVLFEPGRIVNNTGPKDSATKVHVDFKTVLFNTLTVNELLGE